MNIQTVQIADLRPHPLNYNTHPETQIAELEKSLDAFSQFKNIVVCKNTILAGHGLVEAAKRKGMTKLDAVVMDDLTEVQQAALLVADNALPFLAVPDALALQELLAGIDGEIPGVTDDWLDALGVGSVPDIEFKEYDESIADDIELCHCAACGHEHARKK